MYNEILTILKKYRNKFADYEFVRSIINIITYNNNLYDYIKTIDYQYNNKLMGYYRYCDQTIAINLYKIKNNTKSDLNFITKLLSDDDIIMLLNLIVFSIIDHELIHANQAKNYNDLDNNYIENQLYHYDELFKKRVEKYSSKVAAKYLKFSVKMYKKYLRDDFAHNLMPYERVAEIKSHAHVFQLARNLTDNQLIIDYFNYQICALRKENYYNNKCPLENYIEYKTKLANKYGLYIRNESTDNLFNNNLSVELKLLYGLPVNDDVIKNLEDSLQKTKTYQLLY